MFYRIAPIAMVALLSSATALAQPAGAQLPYTPGSAPPTPGSDPPTPGSAPPTPGSAPPTPSAYTQPAEVEPSYHSQVILADMGTLAVAIALLSLDEDPSGNTLRGGYLLGAPIVHLVHGNLGRAAGSLGLRVGLPILGSFTGALIGLSQDEPGSYDGLDNLFEGVLSGFFAGIGAAMIIDWTILSGEKEIKAARGGRAVVSPQFAVGRDGRWSVGLGGSW